MFIRNAWYVAAWDHEILGDTLLERTLLGESVLLYRTEAGTPVALSNKCPHRHAPLSMGRREGDTVRCMYHGLRFDPTGACVEIPGQATIPASTCVRTYPVVQQHRWIWIWMGEPALADPATIPPCPAQDSPEWRLKPGYMHYQANYLLITDNLLDFSHLSYVHESTLGGSPQIAQTRPQVARLDNGLRVTRRVRDTVPAPYHQRLGRFEGKVDRWFIYDFVLPGVLLMEAGVKPTGRPDEDMNDALLFNSTQALTPEREDTTHYFYMQAHAFALNDATVTEAIYQSLCQAFEEDRRIIEAQAHVLRTTPPAPMLPIGADAALNQFRWLVQRRLQAERPTPAAVASADAATEALAG